MKFLKLIILTIISISTIQSCKSKKKAISHSQKTERVIVNTNTTTPTTTTKPTTTTTVTPQTTVIKTPPKKATYAEIVDTYIDNYSEIAIAEMAQYGIPASITLAQGILESGAGRGKLTQKAQNHFGIKCHSGWTGERVYHDDDEKGECFRKYADAKYSFRDHSLFLTGRSRYKNLFTLRKNDYKGWAKGLKKAGYATDPKYPNKLIAIIEKYNLTQYDTIVLGESLNNTATDTTKPTVVKHTVVKGDTLYNIATRYNMTVATLKEYNGLTSNDISIGQLLYLHPTKQ